MVVAMVHCGGGSGRDNRVSCSRVCGVVWYVEAVVVKLLAEVERGEEAS